MSKKAAGRLLDGRTWDETPLRRGESLGSSGVMRSNT